MQQVFFYTSWKRWKNKTFFMFSEGIARDQGMEWVNIIEKLPVFSGFTQIYLRIEIKFKNIWGALVDI